MESLMINYCEDEEDFLPATEISSTLNNNDLHVMDLSQESNEEDMPLPDTTENILGKFGALPLTPTRVLSVADSTNDSLKGKPNNVVADCDEVVVVSDDDDDSTNDVISAIVISRVETVVEEPIVDVCSSSDLTTTAAVLAKSSSKCDTVSVTSTSKKNNSIEEEVTSQTQSENSSISVKEKLRTKHVKQVPKLRIFKCNLCPYSSMIRFGLTRHLLTHSDSKKSTKLKCTNCSYETESKHSLIIHCVNKHKSATVKCAGCRRRVPLQLQSDHSLRCKKKNKHFRCNGCGYKTIEQKSLLLHRKTCAKIEHKSIPLGSKSKSSNCKYCSYSSKFKNKMEAHYAYHTIYNRPIYRCRSCDFKSFKMVVSRHYSIAHKAELLANNNIRRCIDESLREVTKKPLKPIKEKSSGKGNKQEFSCNRCSYIACNSGNLTRHIGVCNKPIYSCDNCDYKSIKLNLSRHSILVHGVQQNFKDAVPKYEEENRKIPKYEDINGKFLINDDKNNIIPKLEDKNHKIPKLENHKIPKLENHKIPKFEDKNQKIPKFEVKNEKIPKYEDKNYLKFRCTICSFSTRNNQTFEYHGRVHAAGKQPIVSCTLCDYKGFKLSVGRHIKIFHSREINNHKKMSASNISVKTKTITAVKQLTEDVCSSSQADMVSVPFTKNHSIEKIKQEVSSHAFHEKPGPSSIKELQSKNAEQVPSLKIFKCNLCPYSSMIRFGLKRHLLTHSDSNNSTKLKCANCLYETESKHYLVVHCVNKHKTNNVKCGACHRLVPLQLQNDHLLRCKKRKSKFQFIGSFYKPLLRHRNKGEKCKPKWNSIPSNSKLITCKYCSYSTRCKKNLFVHCSNHTVYNRPMYRCSICDFKSFKIIVSRHFNVTHKAKLIGNNNVLKFIDESSREIPVQKKNQIKKINKRTGFPCTICSYNATSAQTLTRHFQLHTNQPIYSCDNCDYKSIKRNLYRHSSRVHGVHQVFNEDKNVKNRKILKNEEKNNKTPKYEDQKQKIPKHDAKNQETSTKNPKILKREAKNHKIPNSKLRRRCTLCSYSTCDHSSFAYHEGVHAAGKVPVLQCSLCDYTGFQRSIGIHFKKIHGGKIDKHEKKFAPNSPVKNKNIPQNKPSANILYVCEICDYSTKNKDILINHKLKHSELKKTNNLS